jgi:hypothetical protein
MKTTSSRSGESGIALVTVIMVLMLASALMVGFLAAIVADQRSNGVDRDQTQAYAAAHAGLEKLTSDLAGLFTTDYSPSTGQINTLMTHPPTITGFSYTAPGGAAGSGYAVTWTPDPTPGANFGNPIPDSATGTTITAGPYAGFKGIITRYPITVTALSSGGAEVRLRRELQTVAVPVFQFGVFSETDLTMYAGEVFNFGGRVQTNGNLFLAELRGQSLNLLDRVTVFQEVIRKVLSNGLTVAATFFDGTVNVISSTSGTLRALAVTEGSVTDGPGSPLTVVANSAPTSTTWTTISHSTYKDLIRNGLTGAKYLSLPLVSQGATPVDLIRRPIIVTEDTTNALVYGQRYFAMASLRILLSDTAAEISNATLPTVTATAAVPLGIPVPTGYVAGASKPPFPASPGLVTMTTHGMNASTVAAGVYTIPLSAALPAYFRIPTLTVTRGATTKTATCTGRTATTFTGCVVLPVSTTTMNNPSTVSASVSCGGCPGGLLAVQNDTTSNWNSTGTSTITLNNTVGTTPFAPTVFWLNAQDGGAFNCTGYDTTPALTGCTGLAAAPGLGAVISTGALEAAGTPLNRGFIKIEMQANPIGTNPPVWTDVTAEILNLGVAGPANVFTAPNCDPTPNAVIRLYHVRDNVDRVAGVCNTAAGTTSANTDDYWPNVLYDTREGNFRDQTRDPADFQLAYGGMMNYVAFDVNNFRRWLAGTIGASGANALNQNGFVVYFSDRRNNKNQAVTPVETGEYGFEDVVNPTGRALDGLMAATGDPSGVLETGEDVNAPTPLPVVAPFYVPVLDDYGKFPQICAATTATSMGCVGVPAAPLVAATRPWHRIVGQWVGMVNRPIFFRRALKLVNGGLGNLPAPGLTVASENPVYVQGNYNASTTVLSTDVHQAAAILGDSITLLSNGWNDANSFQAPNDRLGRVATTTGYRFAAVAGKSLSFPFPAGTTVTASGYFLFGTDGGVANFLKYMEEWPMGTSINYRGSIVSLFISRQATGTYKCCERVYDYSGRNYFFDTDFLLPALLPPATPMFRDVNTLTFRQLLRPNQ